MRDEYKCGVFFFSVVVVVVFILFYFLYDSHLYYTHIKLLIPHKAMNKPYGKLMN